MNPEHFEVGDSIKASPVGPGTMTGITQAGYPQVNNVAVTWMEREDGAVYDPHSRVGGTRGPTAGVKEGHDESVGHQTPIPGKEEQ